MAEDDYISVNLDEVPQILSDEEMRVLGEQMNCQSTNCLSEEILVHDFAVAKTFIVNVISNVIS